MAGMFDVQMAIVVSTKETLDSAHRGGGLSFLGLEATLFVIISSCLAIMRSYNRLLPLGGRSN